MELKELYELMKGKLRYMYEHNKDTIILEQSEFFTLYKLVCDMMQIKKITDMQ